MNEEKNSKRMFYVIMGIALTLVLGIGISFAVFTAQANRNVNLVTTGTLQIRYTEGSTITADNLKPATVEQVKEAYTHGSCVYAGDRTTNIQTEKICAYKTFTITNIGSLTAYTKVILEDITNTYQNLMYQLFETTPDTLSGINLLNTTELVNDIELLPNGNKTYTLLIWLDESATIETDQNKSYTAKITASAKATNEFVLEDPSNANRPVLADGMIPVKHNGTTWVKANATGDYNQWYDYGNKQWANAVMVSSATRDTYMTADVGTPVQEEDILAYYVWIPRYKYQLFNIEFEGVDPDPVSAIINENNAINTLEYKNDITINLNQVVLTGYEQLINVQFESGTASTGTVTCSVSEIGVETCTNKANGNWYTHPAFTFGNEQLQGIWVGKFETGYGTNTTNVYPSDTVYETPTIKPNVTSLRNQQISKQFQTAQYFGTSAYLTSTGVNEVDAHMMKNIEWGAVAYLKQSAYGLGTTDIAINNSSNYLTGKSSGDPAVTDISDTGFYSYNENKIVETIKEGSGTNVSYNITNDTTYPWIQLPDGTYKSQTEGIDESITNLTVTFTLTDSGAISFDYSASTEDVRYDYLYYTITNSSGTVIDSTGTGTAIGGFDYGIFDSAMTFITKTHNLEAGSYTVVFTYTKDDMVSDGADAGYVKNIKVLDNVEYVDDLGPAGQLASTTGNITGVYDMSGGAGEYTMGVIQDNTTSGRSPMSGYSTSENSGYVGKVGKSYADSTNTLAFPAAKYYDLYANVTMYSDQTAYNRSHLGDAMGETRVWYDDSAGFPYAYDPWFIRGGRCLNGSNAGVFYFTLGGGYASTTNGFRVALSTTGA